MNLNPISLIVPGLWQIIGAQRKANTCYRLNFSWTSNTKEQNIGYLYFDGKSLPGVKVIKANDKNIFTIFEITNITESILL